MWRRRHKTRLFIKSNNLKIICIFSQLIPFSVLQIVESCEDHVASILGYIVEHPNMKNGLNNALRALNKFIQYFDNQRFHENKFYLRHEIETLCSAISTEITFFEEQLTTHMNAITCEQGYNQKLREVLHIGGDQILTKCIRKLTHIEYTLENNQAIFLKQNRDNANVEIKKAVQILKKFQSVLSVSKTALPSLPIGRKAIVSKYVAEFKLGIGHINSLKAIILSEET